MILRPTRRRTGTSLVEVLVGFGIMGIGVTSVITLFPFSALTIGQALRDDRTTTCAIMADGLLRAIHRTNVVEVGDTQPAKENYPSRMDNPQTMVLVGGQAAQLPQLQPKEQGPSYPVFIDPMGVFAGGQAVGDGGETGIPRVSLSLIQNEGMALRYCSLMDSLTYDESGAVSSNAASMRELRYNFAWMVQRPTNRDRSTMRMQVVVYNKRAHLYRPTGTESVHQNIVFTPGETRIDNVPIPVAPQPNITKGTWVLDGTINPTHADLDGVVRPLRHAEFYRVVSVTDAGNGTYSLEVHKPISRADGMINPANTALYQYTGNLVVMPGVVDVFDRPNLTAGYTP